MHLCILGSQIAMIYYWINDNTEIFLIQNVLYFEEISSEEHWASLHHKL